MFKTVVALINNSAIYAKHVFENIIPGCAGSFFLF